MIFMWKNTGEAINEIEKEIRIDSRLYSDFLICQNKYNSINHDYYKGIIDDHEHGLRNSKLLDSVLTLIDRLEQKDLQSFKDSLLPADNPSLSESVEHAHQSNEDLPVQKSPSPPFIKSITRKLLPHPRLMLVAALLFIVAMAFLFRGHMQILTRQQTPDETSAAQQLTTAANSYVPSDFEIIERRSTIDFRAWRRVPIHLMQTDRFEPMIWHQYLKKGRSLLGEGSARPGNKGCARRLLDGSPAPARSKDRRAGVDQT